jgi:nucleotide-binding universal stress UspA family protein
VGDGPVIVGYDGSPPSERALDEAVRLLPRPVLVVSVWQPGLAFEVTGPTLAPAPIDIRAALEIDEKLYEEARQTAARGADRAQRAGRDVESLAVADEITVAGTLVRLAKERDAAVVAVGTRGRGLLREALLGSTAHELVHDAPCPVLVARAP